MKLLAALSAISLCVACTSAPSAPHDKCSYLADFQRLQTELPKLHAATIAARLEAYAATHENPAACEGNEIDRLLNAAETALFYLIADGSRFAAQVSYRCNEFDATTARCESPMMDGTAHPFSQGLMPLTPPSSLALRIATEKPDAKLHGVYLLLLADALDGKAATLLATAPIVQLPINSKNVALIAIYQTPGPWRYRKIVWYF